MAQKKKKLVVHKSAAVQDKKIVALAKKAGAKNIGETAEVNVFKDDNSVLHFKKPKIEYSLKEKVTFLTGSGETKQIKDLLPNVLKQLGPKQFNFIKDYVEQLKGTNPSEPKKDEQAPELVEDFEEVSKQN